MGFKLWKKNNKTGNPGRCLATTAIAHHPWSDPHFVLYVPWSNLYPSWLYQFWAHQNGSLFLVDFRSHCWYLYIHIYIYINISARVLLLTLTVSCWLSLCLCIVFHGISYEAELTIPQINIDPENSQILVETKLPTSDSRQGRTVNFGFRLTVGRCLISASQWLVCENQTSLVGLGKSTGNHGFVWKYDGAPKSIGFSSLPHFQTQPHGFPMFSPSKIGPFLKIFPAIDPKGRSWTSPRPCHCTSPQRLWPSWPTRQLRWLFDGFLGFKGVCFFSNGVCH